MMVEESESVRNMYHGFDYTLDGTARERRVMMAGAIEWILDMQEKSAARGVSREGQKTAHRRYQDAVLALSKAFSLVSASDEARTIRAEVGFFQASCDALMKSSGAMGVGEQERGLALRQ